MSWRLFLWEARTAQPDRIHSGPCAGRELDMESLFLVIFAAAAVAMGAYVTLIVREG